MNHQLIEKVIKSNHESCPEIVYQNPLLDKKVASALSKSLLKILNISSENSRVNNNLRLSILENIRKMCKVQPEGHVEVDENFTHLFTEFYDKHIKESNEMNPLNTTDKKLESFFIRTNKGLDISSKYEPSLNPETVQALINLNENGIYLHTLCSDVIHWNNNNSKYINILKSLWSNDNNLIKDDLNDDISVKMKGEIEKTLLDICNSILLNKIEDLNELFSTHTFLKTLVTKCSVSADCFQISCGILNFIFIMMNFDTRLQAFIFKFVNQVKMYCPQLTFSVLYPIHINHVVVLLDIDLNVLPPGVKNKYVDVTLKYLHEIENQCDKDLILLLSHFPQWFDVYIQYKEDKNISS